MSRLLIGAVLVAAVSCPVGAHAERATAPVAAAAPLPMCYITIARDADYPDRIYWHEMAHCWGWVHPERTETPKFGQLKSSFKIPLRYRMMGNYPASRVEVYYYEHKMVAQECNGNPYGCAWGGLMP